MDAAAPLSSSDSEDETDILSFAPAAKKWRRSTDFTRCLICQQDTNTKTSKAHPESIQKLCDAANTRQDDVFWRLESQFEFLKDRSVV